MFELICGDAKEVLAGMESGSVHCCVTSPPYWGLRDYGTPGQLGLEKTPEEYVAKMVEVFREVKRVLRDDGTLWLNLGDSYSSQGGGQVEQTVRKSDDYVNAGQLGSNGRGTSRKPAAGMKPKDLVGIPWMVAFALRADGWYLRQDIIWHKPNPMPESVRDRCTKSHEYIFLLSKSPKYYFDAEAIKEPSKYPEDDRKSRSYKTPDGWDTPKGEGGHGSFHKNGREKGQKRYPTDIIAGVREGSATYTKRNKRSVWEIEDHNALISWLIEAHPDVAKEFLDTTPDVWSISTKPFKGAHFATFPPDLIEPCILAGCPEKCCPKCGKGWERVVEKVREHGIAASGFPKTDSIEDDHNGHKRLHRRLKAARDAGEAHDNPLGGAKTIGFQPSCTCNAQDHIPGTVLDIFSGAATTGVVSLKHFRRFIGIELNETYINEIALPRLESEAQKHKQMELFN